MPNCNITVLTMVVSVVAYFALLAALVALAVGGKYFLQKVKLL